MPVQDAELPALKQAGLEAIRRGDAAGARTHFEQIVAAGRADALVWLALAVACKALADKSACAAAIDQVLALEPRNVRALIMKGDHFSETGDIPTALPFYRAALKSAATAGQIPAELAKDIRRVDGALKQFAKGYEIFLHERLAQQGFDAGRSSRRFQESLDLLHGKRQLYLQQPQHYYFPGLPQIQFYERSDFPWMQAVEAATGDIRAEAMEVLKDDQAFSPYVTRERKERPQSDQLGMLNNPDWGAFFLWKEGRLVTENAARCPQTLRALEGAPVSRAAGRMPSVLFSLLRPRTRIPPHTGMLNSRLICHLPLIVPEGCGFRVGNEVRQWVEGQSFIFDDSIEHEAWNDSDSLRVILIFEIWRPELNQEERTLVSAMLEAIDEYGAAQTKWEN